jgi:LysM domain
LPVKAQDLIKIALKYFAQNNATSMKKFSMRFYAKTSLFVRLSMASVLCAFAGATFSQTSPAALATSTEGNVLEVRKDAPDSYTVVRGDTLWAISGRFLAKPWRWPEIWQLNREQINNPHLIYPGNIVYLDRSGATPRLRLGKAMAEGSGAGALATNRVSPMVRSEPADTTPITTINMQAIRPFLTQHMVLGENAFKASPRIFATPDGRVYLTRGDVGYVRNLPDDGVSQFQIYRNATPLLDPDTRKPLAYEALLIGSAQLERKGDPATIRITSYSEEIGPGDRLVPAIQADPIRAVPRSPTKPVSAKVLAIHRGVYAAGRNSVIAISSGRDNGLEVGHVLAIRQKGVIATDREDGNKQIKLPDETAGHIFVFRVFEKVSYALIMSTEKQVAIGDAIVNP